MSIQSEFKKFEVCPCCKKGHIIHTNDHYYCNQPNEICNFYIPSVFLDEIKITKTKMVSLIRNGFLEPMYVNVYFREKMSNGWVVLKDNKVSFIYGNYFSIVQCPKCSKNDVIMRYSEKKDFLFYTCKDYDCNFFIPQTFRNKPIKVKDVIKLCAFEKVAKQFVSKNDKKYTLNLFLDNEFKLVTEF